MKIPKLNTESHWISLSDMMTGLMIIFLFVAVSYMSKNASRTQSMTNDLKEIFKNENSNQLKLGENLNFIFSDVNLCFKGNSAELSPAFKEKLDDFTPKLIGFIMKSVNLNSIAEIRVEGHTAVHRMISYKENIIMNDYKENLALSLERAKNVLSYMMRSFEGQPTDKLLPLFSAAGFSCGRILNKNKKIAFTDNTTNGANAILSFSDSRRVEIKIILKE